MVMVDKIGDETLRIAHRQRRIDPNTITLDGSVIAFQFAIALGIIGRSSNVGHATNLDEFLEIYRDKLRTVVGNNSRRGMGKLFPRPWGANMYSAP